MMTTSQLRYKANRENFARPERRMDLVVSDIQVLLQF